jgi:hypothetical protein
LFLQIGSYYGFQNSAKRFHHRTAVTVKLRIGQVFQFCQPKPEKQNGKCILFKSKEPGLPLKWRCKLHIATACINVKNCTTRITYTDPVASRKVEFTV